MTPSPPAHQTSIADAAERDALIDELAALTTERVSDDRGDLEALTTEELVRAMNAEDRLVPAAVGEHASEIALAVDGIVERMRRGGRLFYLGAGTAGRIGVLDASECPPTFGTDPSLIVALIAGGPSAIHTAVEGAEDDEEAAAAELADHSLGADDIVVGISASGRSPYVVGGLRYAGRVGALAIAIASNAGSAIGAVADIAIEVVVGPEFVAGSTRLKSGTAQKLVVNMLTTLAMIKLGKTYQGVMVDLQATNRKLHARSVRTVMALAEVDADTAQVTLASVGGSVKQAILVLRAGVSAADAAEALDASGGMLGDAIAAAGA
jgi:N-acetylmuramic acid 6-phosphate etherase